MASTLEELVARIKKLPPAERAKLEADTISHQKWGKALWVPNPGPQTDAYYSKADVLLYGGSAAGGKSDLGIGLAFTEHQKSLVLRRRYSDVGALIERAVTINGTRNGFNGTPPPILRTVNGKFIQFGANQHPGDEQSFQGRDYDFKCVAMGTRVVMADNSLLPIEDISVGDMVDTLDGPRAVTRVFPSRHDEGVLVQAFSGDGKLLAQQVQSCDHELLYTSASAFLDSACEPLPSWFSSPSEVHGGGLRPQQSAMTCGTFLPRHLSSVYHWQRMDGSYPQCAHLCNYEGNDAALEAGRQGSDCAGSGEPRQGVLRLPLSSDRLGLLLRLRELCVHTCQIDTPSTQYCDEHLPLEPLCFQESCSFYTRLYGGRVRQFSGLDYESNYGQGCLQQSSYVELPSPNCFEGGVQGKTPICIRRIGTYSHPYTKDIHLANRDAIGCVFQYSSIGSVCLHDIEVESANHYITEGGFVNKNCFDEACHFLESQIHFHLGWLRSADPNQRCRAVLASNPPTSSDGDWLVGMFRPWLDMTHHNPAEAGELRWFISVDGNTNYEVPFEQLHRDEHGRYCYTLPDGDIAYALSRTFIPAKLSDNPYLAKTNYKAQLDALPEPLRSAVRDGNFMLSRQDAEWQVIPTQWIIAAQARWKPDGWKGGYKAMSAISMDPAGGGKDSAEIMWRYDNWYSEPLSKTGADTADGSASAATLIKYRRDAADVIVDVGGGYGGSVTLRLSDNDVPYISFQPAGISSGRTKDRQLKFANKRAEAWWRFREALDPDQEGGSPIALPPSPELRSDLAAPTYSVGARGIVIEDKERLRQRLGRSPGKGDACVMCHLAGGTAIRRGMRSTSADPRAANLPKFAKRRAGPLTRKR